MSTALGMYLDKQLSARSESAGGENNFRARENAVVCFYADHRAALVPLEREHRRGEAHLDILFPFHRREEKIGDGFILFPRV